MIELKIDDNLRYQYDEEASFEKDGKTYEFVSLKKIQTFKGKDGKENSKFQNLTVAHKHLDRFKDFLSEIIGRQPGEEEPF